MNRDIQTKSNLPAHVVEFRSIVRPTNYSDIVICTSPKLRPFAAKYGNEALEDIVMGVLAELSEGLALPVSPAVLSDAASLIIQEWPDTKLSDLILFKNEMLLGNIGGQIKDQIWKWSTRTIIQSWREYYEVREDVFCEAREKSNDLYKSEYNNGIIKAYAKASPETKKLIKETTENIERFIKSKRIEAEESRPIFTQNLSLNEIADMQGIDKEILAKKIRQNAEVNFMENGKKDETIDLYISYELSRLTFEARKNPSILLNYI